MATKPNYSGMSKPIPPLSIDTKSFIKVESPLVGGGLINQSVPQWNIDVEANMQQSYIQDSKPLSTTQLNAIDKNLRDQAIKQEISLDTASTSDKLGAMGDVFSKHNDFSLLMNKDETPSFKPDNEWIKTVSSFDNAQSLALSSELPSGSEVKISQTKSYEEFLHLSNKLKDDAAQSQHISNTIGSGLQTTAIIGAALTGLDTAAAIAMPWAAELGVARIFSKIEGLESALAAEKVLASQRAVAQVANLSVATAIPVIQSSIHEDFTATDGAISFIVNAGFNRWQLNKVFNPSEYSLTDTISTFKAKEVLDRLGDTNLLLPSPSKFPMLEYKGYRKSDDVIYQGMTDTGLGTMYVHPNQLLRLSAPAEVKLLEAGIEPRLIEGAKSGVFEGSISKITSALKDTRKAIDKAVKTLENTRIGSKLRTSTEESLVKSIAKLNELNSLNVAMRKGKTLASQAKVSQKLSKQFPELFKDDVASGAVASMNKILSSGVKSVEKNMYPEDIAKGIDDVLNAHGGTSIMAKVTKDGIVAGVKTASGKFKAFANQNKMKTLIGASIITTAAAMADDGGGSSSSEGSIFVDIPKLAIAAFIIYAVGGSALKAMNSSAGLIGSMGGAIKKMYASASSSELARTPAGEYVGKLYAAHNATLIAMGMPFKTLWYKGTDATKQVAKDLFFDPDNASSVTAEVMKKRGVSDTHTIFYSSYNKAFEDFSKLNKKSATTFLGKFDAAGDVKRKFNESISFAIENPSAIVDPSIRAVANTAKILFNDMNKRAIEAGVKGFTEKLFIENYIPQITATDSIARMIIAYDGSLQAKGVAYNLYKNQFKRMYEAKHIGSKGYDKTKLDAIGDEIMNDIIQANNSGIRGNVADILGDTISNAKARREFDKTVFEPFNLEVNGVTTTIDLGKVFERDIETLMNGYSNAMEGHIALAKKGYKSYTEALDIIGSDASDVTRIGTIAINQLIGRVNYDTSSTMAQMVRGLSNLTPAVLMSTSAIMQIKEAGSTFIRSAKNWEHFKTATSELTNVLRGRGSDDAYVNFIMKMTTEGNTMMANKLHSRLFDDSAHITEGQINTLSASFAAKTARAKDFAMIAYGVAPITDLGQRMNGILNMDLLTKVAHGTKKLTKTEMETYGLNENILAKVRKNLTLNKKGNLTDSSVKSLEENAELYEEIGNVVFNMSQSQMLTPMIGTTPAFFHESALGMAMGNLMSFAFNAHNTYGTSLVKGASRGEPSAYLDLTMWFGTMYAAQELKDGIKGKERTEQEKVMSALVQMPLSAPLSFVSMATSPVITAVPDIAVKETTSQMASLADVMAGGEYE